MLYNRICDITPPLLYNMLHNMTQPSRWGPSLRWPRSVPAAAGTSKDWAKTVLTRVRKSQWNCVWPSFLFQKAPETWPEEAQCSGGSFGWLQAGYCLEIALTGDSILLVWLLTFLSTNMQSLEPPIQGSTELGLTKFVFHLSFRYWLPDSMFQRFSGFLT